MRRRKPALLVALAVVFGVALALWVWRPGRPAARVNGETITSGQLAGELQERFGDVVLQDLISERLIQQAATQYGLEVPPEELDLWAADLRQQPETQQAVESGRLTEERLRRNLESAIPLYLVALRDVPENGRKQFFREHRRQLQELRMRHIVLESEELALEVLGRLKDPAEFPVMARVHSLDPRSRERGGDLGMVSRAELEASFDPEEVARLFHLPEGRISAPLRARSGAWHLFLVEQRRVDYETLRRRVVQEMARERVGPCLDSLRSRATIVIPGAPAPSPSPKGGPT